MVRLITSIVFLFSATQLFAQQYLSNNNSTFEKKHNNYSRYFDSIVGRAKFRGGVIGVDYAEAFVVAKKIEI